MAEYKALAQNEEDISSRNTPSLISRQKAIADRARTFRAIMAILVSINLVLLAVNVWAGRKLVLCWRAREMAMKDLPFPDPYVGLGAALGSNGMPSRYSNTIAADLTGYVSSNAQEHAFPSPSCNKSRQSTG